jgi:hypothetical protein
MRFGKRPLCLPFAIAVEDCTTEQKDEHRDGEDERTKRSRHVGRQPPQRQLPAVLLHGSFVNRVLWQTTVAHEGGISRAQSRCNPARNFMKPASAAATSILNH